jgi:hypothetical protein
MSAPHPLAEDLINRLHSGPKTRVLDFASGRGRNGEALRRAGLRVVSVSDEEAASDGPVRAAAGPFTAVLSTHGFLHGTAAAIAARMRAVAKRLAGDGLFYATFGSVRDARFGHGHRIDESTYTPMDGDERGVAHAYFDREALLTILEPNFVVESLREERVDQIAGSWAHPTRPLGGAVHWFVIARKR